VTDTLERILPATLIVCAAILLLTLCASVLAAVWLDLRVVARKWKNS
jgi:hypothetical protein